MKLAKEKLRLGYPENLVKFKDFYALMVKCQPLCTRFLNYSMHCKENFWGKNSGRKKAHDGKGTKDDQKRRF